MKLTWLLCLAMVVVFFAVVFLVGDIAAFYEFYGFSGANMIERPYVLFTSIFLHASLEHLLANVLVLLFFGLAVEKEIRAGRMLLLFLLGAIAGDLLSLLIYPWHAIGVGASAGIFALIGTGMLLKPLDLSLYPLIVPVPLLFLGVAYALYNVYGFFFLAGNISYIAHFGGLFVGLAVGFMKKRFGKK